MSVKRIKFDDIKTSKGDTKKQEVDDLTEKDINEAILKDPVTPNVSDSEIQEFKKAKNYNCFTLISFRAQKLKARRSPKKGSQFHRVRRIQGRHRAYPRLPNSAYIGSPCRGGCCPAPLQP